MRYGMVKITRKWLQSCHPPRTRILWIGNYKMEQAFCPFLFFLFFFGGWRTTLMAASKTAFIFCIQRQRYTFKVTIFYIFQTFKDLTLQRMRTCCVFELHSMYIGAPISFLSSSPFKKDRKTDHKPIKHVDALVMNNK